MAKKSIIEYIAFLRGINVGGNKLIRMEELRGAFENLGFRNVKTLLASGNVLFESSKSSQAALTRQIEEKLAKTFGHEVPVILRTTPELQKLVDSNPFQRITVTPQTRLYVTFLSEKPKSNLKVPYESPELDFKIVRVSEAEVCSVLILTPNRRSIDAMKVLDKKFGKKTTTRNWNTINKITK